ncbi:MAG: hypothetical protein WCJ49_08345, partial [Deltaproteobacteria bacterium]
LRVRPENKVKKVFLVEKGPLTGQPISIRGIQKRMEYYARKTNLKISCHSGPAGASVQKVTVLDLDFSSIFNMAVF